MLAARWMCVPSLLLSLLLLSVSVCGQSSAWSTQSLTLSLFNDSACAVPSSLAVFNQTVVASYYPPYCQAASPSLQQVGYSAYSASCGDSIVGSPSNPYRDPTHTSATVYLWYNTSTNATTCPDPQSLTAFIGVIDSTLTHTNTSCVGPFRVTINANRSVPVREEFVYAQWDCETITAPNAALHMHSIANSNTLIIMILSYVLLLWLA